MEVEELIAREEIRDVLSRLAVLGDRGLVDDMMPLYAVDATFEIKGQSPVIGRDAIRRLFLGIAGSSDSKPASDGETPPATSSQDRPSFARHVVTNSTIDVKGTDRADVTSYFTIVTPRGISAVGRWFDSFAIGEGRWQLCKRVVRQDRVENP